MVVRTGLACVLLVLFRSAAAQSPAPLAVWFTCADGRSIEATFDNREPPRVTLNLAGTTIGLPQVVSASGARYSDGQTVFWTKGREALFAIVDGSTLCQTIR
jgi:putative lipoprotein